MKQRSNASAWSLPGVVRYFQDHRATTGDVYRSEWHFIKHRLREGMSILDIGCAQGGFAGVFAEHLQRFDYTGIDISAEMITAAQTRFPRHRFLAVPEGDYSALGQTRYDLVLVLGILHLHESWRDTVRAGWRHTGRDLILDLREHDGPTIEDKSRSYMRMDFGSEDETYRQAQVPYIILNTSEAEKTVRELCPEARNVSGYGYTTPVTSSATTPSREVKAAVYCIER